MSVKTQAWQYCYSWLVLGSVLITSLQERVFAQITPDNTLPNNSSVTRDGNTFNINGGTQTGSNLFHSFSEFSVPNAGTADFNNVADIQNIISRVTGGSASNIDGLIKANGTANLFLINPNGIIFGQGARLDIGGSFVGTTADAIRFGEQGFFSAENPESSSSLLSVNPEALLFNQITTASIQNNSVADSGLNPSSEFIATGLRVPDGKSLLLVGGDINMDGGGLFAFGGRVELGGLAGAGTVGLNVAGEDGSNLSLSFPNSVEKSDVTLGNGARVNVGYGGSIAVNARNLEITGDSTEENETEENEQGGGSNFISGLIELPRIPVDTEVAQGCYSPGYAQNRFVIVGRGGLPFNPKEILTPDMTQVDWVSVKPSNNNRSLPRVTITPTTSTPQRIVEPTSATLNAKGQIVLSANSSTVTLDTSRQNSTQCHGS